MTGDDTLTQRRAWFRFFPEGTIEFTVVTRVLALAMMVAVGVMPGNEEVILLALCALLWIDYLLMLWWGIQLSSDLDDLFQDSPPAFAAARRKRLKAMLIGAVPSAAALTVIAPWPDVLRSHLPALAVSASTARWLDVGFGVIFVAALFPAARALSRLGTGPMHWTGLYMIPLVHWFAIHRLMLGWNDRLERRAAMAGDEATSEESARGVILAADVLWALTVLPWASIVVLALVREGTPEGSAIKILTTCGVGIAIIFAITDLAAMENLQRRFVALVRRR